MASMLSLLDVLPQNARVDIGGSQIDVFGISGEDIGKILGRYPNAFQQLAESAGKPGGLDQGLLGAVIAASQRNGTEDSLLGNEVVEKRARALPLGAQMKVMQAIGRLTFADGIGPFLEGIMSASSAANEAMEIVVRLVSKGQDTASPRTLKRSEPPGTQVSGSSPPDK